VKQPSNPFSSGGGGDSFEKRVAATYLVALLAGEVPRGLSGGIADRVQFQVRPQGIGFDDLLVTSTAGSIQRRLALQIKHSLTFSEGNQKFHEVISAAWETWTSARGWEFRRGADRLGIGLGVLPETVHRHLLPMLEWARTCLSAKEFLDKVGRHGVAAEPMRSYLKGFRWALNRAAGRKVSDEELWLFLRDLVILGFDLENEGSRDAHFARCRLQDLFRDPIAATLAYGALFEEASRLDPLGGSVDARSLRERIGERLPLQPLGAHAEPLARLKEHSTLVFADLRSDLAGKLHLPRPELSARLETALDESIVVLIAGEPGSGKSGLQRDLAVRLAMEGPVLLVRADELDFPMLGSFLASLGIDGGLEPLLNAMSSAPRRCLMIDSAERALTLRNPRALIDLVNAILLHNRGLERLGAGPSHRWRIVMTCRASDTAEVLRMLHALETEWQQGRGCVVGVPPLNDEEMEEVFAAFPQIRRLWGQGRVQHVLRLPFYLDILGRQELGLSGIDPGKPCTEAMFAEAFWRVVVRRQPGVGEPLAREQALLQLAQRYLAGEGPRFETAQLDLTAIRGLVSDQVLRERDGLVSFAHDVFADWAIAKLLAQKEARLEDFLEEKGETRRLDRPFQLWVCRTLEEADAAEAWRNLAKRFERHPKLSPRWHSLVISAPLESAALEELLNRFGEALLEDATHLTLFLRALRTVAVTPLPKLDSEEEEEEGEGLLRHLLRFEEDEEQGRSRQVIPHPAAVWIPVLGFLAQPERRIPLPAIEELSEVLSLWLIKGPSSDPSRRETALLALKGVLSGWESKVESSKRDSVRERLLEAALVAVDAIPSEIEALLRDWISTSPGHPPAILSALDRVFFTPLVSLALAQGFPDLLAEVTLARLRRPLKQPRRGSGSGHSSGYRLGLHERLMGSRPSPFRGPFLPLLRYHPEVGLPLILELVNDATDRWVAERREGGRQPLPQKLRVNGKEQKIWGDASVWGWVRDRGSTPKPVVSALMALEYWLSKEVVQEQSDAERLFKRILGESRSAALIAVLVLVVLEHPLACAQLLLPVYEVPAFWSMDRTRWGHERRHPRGLELRGLPVNLMRADEEVRRELLPIVRSFPMNLPYTDESEVGNEAAEERLRKECEFMVLDADVDNLILVRMADGNYLVPAEVPEHLQEERSKVDERLRRSLEDNSLDVFEVKGWAEEVLESRQGFYHPTREEALALAKELDARSPDEPHPFTEDSAEIVPSVAAALLITHYEWLRDTGNLAWCREKVLAEVPLYEYAEEVGNERSTFPLSPVPYLAKALVELILRNPQDEEAREALARLIHAGSWSERRQTFQSLRRLWEPMPDLVWQAIRLGEAVALVEPRIFDRGRRDITRQRDAIIHGQAFKDEPSVLAKSKRQPLVEGLACVLPALPDLSTKLEPVWVTRLLRLYQIYFDLLSKWVEELGSLGPGYYDHRNTVRDWASLFFEKLGTLATRLEPEEAWRLTEPLLGLWTHVPEAMKSFLTAFLMASVEQNSAETFVTVWERLARSLLGSEEVRSGALVQDSSLSECLSAVLFSAPNVKWKIPSWPPLIRLIEIVDLWCAEVGYLRACFSALVSFLDGIGFELFPEHGIRWLDDCLRRADAPDDLLDTKTALALTKLLEKACEEHGDVLRSAPRKWQCFGSLVDHVARTGNPSAIELQARIASLDGAAS